MKKRVGYFFLILILFCHASFAKITASVNSDVIGVGEKAVVVREIGRKRVPESPIGIGAIVRNLRVTGWFRIKSDIHPRSLPNHRRKRENIHHTAVRVAPVERALRTAQNINPPNVEKIEIEGVFVHNRHIVND